MISLVRRRRRSLGVEPAPLGRALMTRRPAAAAGAPGGGAQQKAEEHCKETAAMQTADRTHNILCDRCHRFGWLLHMAVCVAWSRATHSSGSARVIA